MTKQEISAVLQKHFGRVAIRWPDATQSLTQVSADSDDAELALVKFVDRAGLARDLGVTDMALHWECVTTHVVTGSGARKHAEAILWIQDLKPTS